MFIFQNIGIRVSAEALLSLDFIKETIWNTASKNPKRNQLKLTVKKLKLKMPDSDHQNEMIGETTDEVAVDMTTEIETEGEEDPGLDLDRETDILDAILGVTEADPDPDLETDLDETDTKLGKLSNIRRSK